MIGYRKYSVVILAFTLATIFLVTGHIDGTNFQKILVGIGAAFMAANLVNKLTQAAKEYIQEKLKK